jgi:hypothetical protein
MARSESHATCRIEISGSQVNRNDGEFWQVLRKTAPLGDQMTAEWWDNALLLVSSRR